jgi:hypothetical protein
VDDVIRLSPSETVRGRPFADPWHNAEDLAAILTMAARLRRLLSQPAPWPEPPHPVAIEAAEPDGRQHRVIVCRASALGAERDLAFVGFFAKKRLDRDCSPLTAADDELILELPAHPGILSYSSLELPDGNWGNLIVVDPPEAKDHWRTSEKHAWAARELAPAYYTVIRLHNGVFPGGLRSDRDPVLLRTRYWDFRDPAPWRAEREVPPVGRRSPAEA